MPLAKRFFKGDSSSNHRLQIFSVSFLFTIYSDKKCLSHQYFLKIINGLTNMIISFALNRSCMCVRGSCFPKMRKSRRSISLTLWIFIFQSIFFRSNWKICPTFFPDHLKYTLKSCFKNPKYIVTRSECETM